MDRSNLLRNIAVFLAGPGSDYMTGSTFMLEGGMHTLP